MKLAAILHVFFFVTGICLVTSAENGQLSPKPTETKESDSVDGFLDKPSGNVTDGNVNTSGEVTAGDLDTSVSNDKTTEKSGSEVAADSDTETDASDNEQDKMSGGDDEDTNKNEEGEEESKEEDVKKENTNEEDVTKKKDDLNDNPQVLDPDSITDDSDARFHTVKLMLYIIAPVSALVVVYFIMKALKGNNNTFFNRYHIVGARGDNIELRPLGYDSEDEEDIVFESARRP